MEQDVVQSDSFLEKTEPKKSKTEFSKKIFMDFIVYTIFLNENDEIVEIVNHSENTIETDDIKEIALQILVSDDLKDMKIGNLYYQEYSYIYQKQKFLTIMDNHSVQEKLLSSLKFSIFWFGLLEIIIISIAKMITNWIIKPVEASFLKQKQFIADASHELKTPISVIMASSDALTDDRMEDKWLRNIKNETIRMNQLVCDLLDLASLEEEKNQENYCSLDLSKIIEIQVLTFESLAFERGFTLKYDIEKNITFVCQEDQMKQLVSILLDNAMNHSKKKEMLQIKLFKERGEIILTVTNKGEAIAKEDQEKIFERFYRGDKARARKDNRYGLGLAIAKNIVLNHHGKISAYSSDGYTTFKVVFK